MTSISFNYKDIQGNKHKHDLEYCYQIKRKQTYNVIPPLKFVLRKNLYLIKTLNSKYEEEVSYINKNYTLITETYVIVL